jgi:histone-lysine N-methyltransferase SETMAR
LDRANECLKEKRPHLVDRKGVVFHQDNARPHVSEVTQQKIKELNLEIFDHPPYSSDLAPSDYHYSDHCKTI